jgi:hypothetical protein
MRKGLSQTKKIKRGRTKAMRPPEDSAAMWGVRQPLSLQKHYWENFTPLMTPDPETDGAGTQSFKKHAPVPALGSKFQA